MLVGHDELRDLLTKAGVTKATIEEAEGVSGSLGLEDLANEHLGRCNYEEDESQFSVSLDFHHGVVKPPEAKMCTYKLSEALDWELDGESLREALVDRAEDEMDLVHVAGTISVEVDGEQFVCKFTPETP